MKTPSKLGLMCSAFALICILAGVVSAHAQTRATNETRTAIDEVDRRVAVPLQVHRIVTLAPNLTEIVYALGAEDRLVGVSEYSDHPPAAKTKPSIGMPVNPSLEAVVGAKPDLVLATTSINFAKTVDALTHLGIAVYTTNPHSVEGTLRSISDIGEVIGESSRADVLVADLRARLNTLQERLRKEHRVRVLFIVWDQPLQSIGDNTFIADALRWAGAESALHTKQNWPTISMEEVVKLNPDYIAYSDSNLVLNSSDNSSESPDIRAAISHHLDELRREPAWRSLTAVREGHIAVVDEEIEVPAPGLIDTIELLAHELHPNLFTIQSNQQSSSGASPVFYAAPEISDEAALCAR